MPDAEDPKYHTHESSIGQLLYDWHYVITFGYLDLVYSNDDLLMQSSK